MEKLKISVVVPTWNRARMLSATLDSLSSQTLEPEAFEVIVVDDGSTDDTAQVAEEFARSHPALHLRCVSRPNGGVNAARNTGIEAARAPAVCFLDDDELAPPEHLDRIVQHLESHPEVAGVGGPARDRGDSAVRTCSRCSIGSASLAIEGIGTSPELLGGNMTIRREAFDEVGLFDTDLSGRGDEQEWFRRSGLQFLYDSDLYIWHRRDALGLADLCRLQFRQGRSLPRSKRKQGGERWRPAPGRIPRLVAHSLRRRCDKGYVLAARELGATLEWSRLAISGMAARLGRSR